MTLPVATNQGINHAIYIISININKLVNYP